MNALASRLAVTLGSLVLVMTLLGGTTLAQPLCAPGGLCGALVIMPDDRFDPLIQNLLAKQELTDLPSDFHPLFLWMPITRDPALVEHQIRFLHELLKETEDSQK